MDAVLSNDGCSKARVEARDAEADLAFLGAAGRDWVLREFSPEKYRDRTMALYETVVH